MLGQFPGFKHETPPSRQPSRGGLHPKASFSRGDPCPSGRPQTSRVGPRIDESRPAGQAGLHLWQWCQTRSDRLPRWPPTLATMTTRQPRARPAASGGNGRSKPADRTGASAAGCPPPCRPSRRKNSSTSAFGRIPAGMTGAGNGRRPAIWSQAPEARNGPSSPALDATRPCVLRKSPADPHVCRANRPGRPPPGQLWPG
jgi:hypothetical protein